MNERVVTPIGEKHPPLSETIARLVKDEIISGRHQPGDRLIEDHLAEQLGVSRNPVREALRLLESQGFVEIVPRKGASVARISPGAAVELFEVRGALEALGARLAAERATEDDIRALESLIERGTNAVSDGELASLPSLNSEFHTTLMKAAENTQLLNLLGLLQDKIQWVYAQDIRDRAADSWHEHRELFAAVVARDPDRAAHIALHHVDAAKAAFVRNDGA